MAFAQNFGAVGDGKTDDTAALQHAIDDGDGVLELPRGVFRITRPLLLDLTKRGYLGVRGPQGGAQLVMAGPGPAIDVLGDHRGTAMPSTVRDHTWRRERLPIIENLEILGAHEEADGIRLRRTMMTTISGVLIRQCRHGVHLVERNRNFLLSAAHIYDCHDTGVFFDRCNLHQAIITGSHISYCKRAGVRQLDGDVHNIQITGNDIEYNSGFDSVASGEIVLEAPEGVISEYTISSNTLQATNNSAGANVLILGRPGNPPTAVRLISITGNVIGARKINLDLRNVSRGAITGNTIYDGAEVGVALRNCQNVILGSNALATRPFDRKTVSIDGLVMEDCVDCIVSANILNQCRLGDEKSGGAVTLRRCRNCSVSGCQIIDPLFRGVDVVASQRCRISDNTITASADSITMRQAIRITGAGKQNVSAAGGQNVSAAGGQNIVQNNAVGPATEQAIDCPAALGVQRNNTEWS